MVQATNTFILFLSVCKDIEFDSAVAVFAQIINFLFSPDGKKKQHNVLKIWCHVNSYTFRNNSTFPCCWSDTIKNACLFVCLCQLVYWWDSLGCIYHSVNWTLGFRVGWTVNLNLQEPMNSSTFTHNSIKGIFLISSLYFFHLILYFSVAPKIQPILIMIFWETKCRLVLKKSYIIVVVVVYSEYQLASLFCIVLHG